jgi:hypothetical protein
LSTADHCSSVQHGIIAAPSNSGCRARCSSMHTTHFTQVLACPLQITAARCSTVSVLPQATVAVKLVAPACTQLTSHRHWLVHCTFPAARCSTVSVLPQATAAVELIAPACSQLTSHRHWLVHCRFTAARCKTVPVLPQATVAVVLVAPASTQPISRTGISSSTADSLQLGAAQYHCCPKQQWL